MCIRKIPPSLQAVSFEATELSSQTRICTITLSVGKPLSKLVWTAGKSLHPPEPGKAAVPVLGSMLPWFVCPLTESIFHQWSPLHKSCKSCASILKREAWCIFVSMGMFMEPRVMMPAGTDILALELRKSIWAVAAAHRGSGSSG